MRSARDSGGASEVNQLAALDVLWKIARGAADPPQPIRRTAMLGDSEILSEMLYMSQREGNDLPIRRLLPSNELCICTNRRSPLLVHVARGDAEYTLEGA